MSGGPPSCLIPCPTGLGGGGMGSTGLEALGAVGGDGIDSSDMYVYACIRAYATDMQRIRGNACAHTYCHCALSVDAVPHR